jgi:hypothetical protein
VRRGRVVTLGAWLAVTATLSMFNPAVGVWLLVQVGMIWLVRCLSLYHRLWLALADGALTGFSLASAVATALHTHNVFLTLWCFFLLQALFVFIPKLAGTTVAAPVDADTFEQAYRTAEAALRRLATGS